MGAGTGWGMNPPLGRTEALGSKPLVWERELKEERRVVPY